MLLVQGPSPYVQLQRPDHAQFSAPPQQSGFFPEQAPVPSAPQHALQHQPAGPVKISVRSQKITNNEQT